MLSQQTFSDKTGASILMMITSAERSRWEYDILLEDWQEAGLRKPSILRWKIFTIDEQLIQNRRGTVSDRDKQKIQTACRAILPEWIL